MPIALCRILFLWMEPSTAYLVCALLGLPGILLHPLWCGRSTGKCSGSDIHFWRICAKRGNFLFVTNHNESLWKSRYRT